MTLGIATYGRNAGAGALAALAAIERVGRGAIGGFVSLAAITGDGRLIRAETQAGGSTTLFGNGPDDGIGSALLVGLISSGPHRPTPLSGFVSAEPGTGIVTGHRMPQTETPGGQKLNDHVLQKMREGLHPQSAIDAVIAEFPHMDAGFIACSVQGEIGLGSMPSVLSRSDQGFAFQRAEQGPECVATVHNAIHPHRVIAPLANEVALDVMLTNHTPVAWIRMRTGIMLHAAERMEVHVNPDRVVESVGYSNAAHMTGRWSIGLGDRVPIFRERKPLGWLGYEPFMTIVDGRIETIDGQGELDVPVLDHLPHTAITGAD